MDREKAPGKQEGHHDRVIAIRSHPQPVACHAPLRHDLGKMDVPRQDQQEYQERTRPGEPTRILAGLDLEPEDCRAPDKGEEVMGKQARHSGYNPEGKPGRTESPIPQVERQPQHAYTAKEE